MSDQYDQILHKVMVQNRAFDYATPDQLKEYLKQLPDADLVNLMAAARTVADVRTEEACREIIKHRKP